MAALMFIIVATFCIAFTLLVPWRIKKDEEELRKITDDFLNELKKLKQDEGK